MSEKDDSETYSLPAYPLPTREPMPVRSNEEAKKYPLPSYGPDGPTAPAPEKPEDWQYLPDYGLGEVVKDHSSLKLLDDWAQASAAEKRAAFAKVDNTMHAAMARNERACRDMRLGIASGRALHVFALTVDGEAGALATVVPQDPRATGDGAAVILNALASKPMAAEDLHFVRSTLLRKVRKWFVEAGRPFTNKVAATGLDLTTETDALPDGRKLDLMELESPTPPPTTKPATTTPAATEPATTPAATEAATTPAVTEAAATTPAATEAAATTPAPEAAA